MAIIPALHDSPGGACRTVEGGSGVSETPLHSVSPTLRLGAYCALRKNSSRLFMQTGRAKNELKLPMFPDFSSTATSEFSSRLKKSRSTNSSSPETSNLYWLPTKIDSNKVRPIKFVSHWLANFHKQCLLVKFRIANRS